MDDEVTSTIRSLAQYLRTNPHACDSSDGIAQWWLPGDGVSTLALERALEWLARQGVLQAIVGSDGRTRYRRCCNDARLDAALALREHTGRRH